MRSDVAKNSKKLLTFWYLGERLFPRWILRLEDLCRVLLAARTNLYSLRWGWANTSVRWKSVEEFRDYYVSHRWAVFALPCGPRGFF